MKSEDEYVGAIFVTAFVVFMIMAAIMGIVVSNHKDDPKFNCKIGRAHVVVEIDNNDGTWNMPENVDFKTCSLDVEN